MDLGESGESIDDMELLMEVMEVREELEDATHRRDAAARERIGERNAAHIEACVAGLSQLLGTEAQSQQPI